MTRLIESDYSVTPEMAQAVLDAVEAREGPEFTGWSRINPVITRLKTWKIFKNAANMVDGEFINCLIACNIRREFGTDGAKRPLMAPFKRRQRRQETW